MANFLINLGTHSTTIWIIEQLLFYVNNATVIKLFAHFLLLYCSRIILVYSDLITWLYSFFNFKIIEKGIKTYLIINNIESESSSVSEETEELTQDQMAEGNTQVIQ